LKNTFFPFPEVLVLPSEGMGLRNVERYELYFNVFVFVKFIPMSVGKVCAGMFSNTENNA
jgi:hypothetical protein